MDTLIKKYNLHLIQYTCTDYGDQFLYALCMYKAKFNKAFITRSFRNVQNVFYMLAVTTQPGPQTSIAHLDHALQLITINTCLVDEGVRLIFTNKCLCDLECCVTDVL